MLPVYTRLSGRCISVKEVHPLNELSLKEVSPSGNCILFINVHPLNASWPIVVTLTPPISEGITTSVAVPTYLVIVLVSLSK